MGWQTACVSTKGQQVREPEGTVGLGHNGLGHNLACSGARLRREGGQEEGAMIPEAGGMKSVLGC